MHTTYVSSALVEHDRYHHSPGALDASHGSAVSVVDVRPSPPSWHLAHGTSPWPAEPDPSTARAHDHPFTKSA